MNDEDDASTSYRMLKNNRKISPDNYNRALARCTRVIKEFLKNSKKTTIVKDLGDLMKKKLRNSEEETIVRFSLSQKKVLFNQIKLFNNRLMKEFETEVFSDLKSKYM